MTEHCNANIHESRHEHHEETCSKECCDWSEKFLKFADEAWKELLQEKIKAIIEKEHGSHLEKLAEILAKANKERWEYKITAKMKHKEYKETLKEYFSSNK